jgi:chemotaxis methyl-accepting protein methylase
MLIAEHLEQQGTPERIHRVTIDATDIDQRSLERAQTGRYRRDTLAEMPPAMAARYFEQEGRDCRVVQRIRQRVLVRAADLSNDPPPRRNYHLIVCRNVVIYFEREAQERVFATFADALAPGGFLVLGKVETLFGPARQRLTLLDPRERVYRRAA